MYLKSHFVLKSKLNPEDCVRILNNNIGNLKRYSGEVKNDIYTLRRNYGGIWGLTFKIHISGKRPRTRVEVYLQTPMEKIIRPGRAILLMASMLAITPLVFMAISYIKGPFMRFLVILLAPAFIYLIDKISFGKKRTKALDKEVAFMAKLFQAEIVSVNHEPESDQRLVFKQGFEPK